MEIAAIIQVTGLFTGPLVPLLLYALKNSNGRLRQLLAAQSTNTWPKVLPVDLANAEELWFYGIHLKDTVEDYHRLLHEKAQTGKRLRFILADPDGSVFSMVEKRFHGDRGQGEKATAVASLQTLKDLQARYPSVVHVRKIDYLFPRTVYMLDPGTDKAVIYASQHTFRLNGEKTKTRYITGSQPCDLLYREYVNLWEVATAVQ